MRVLVVSWNLKYAGEVVSVDGSKLDSLMQVHKDGMPKPARCQIPGSNAQASSVQESMRAGRCGSGQWVSVQQLVERPS